MTGTAQKEFPLASALPDGWDMVHSETTGAPSNACNRASCSRCKVVAPRALMMFWSVSQVKITILTSTLVRLLTSYRRKHRHQMRNPRSCRTGLQRQRQRQHSNCSWMQALQLHRRVAPSQEFCSKCSSCVSSSKNGVSEISQHFHLPQKLRQ